MTKKLIKHWSNIIPKGWKHFSDYMSEEKINFTIDRVTECLFNFINFDEVSVAIDWGCGGGILSKELIKYCDVALIDISQESLDEAESYIKNNIVHRQTIEDTDNFTYNGPKVDLIFSNAVIHHFPSYGYFAKVRDIWISLSPKFIAVQIKQDDKMKENEAYFDENNFLDGLILNANEFANEFKGYECISQIEKLNKTRTRKMGYYVFEKD